MKNRVKVNSMYITARKKNGLLNLNLEKLNLKSILDIEGLENIPDLQSINLEQNP